MNINFTLFIQAFNFFIAYFLITKFFLRPALAVVVQENSEQENLEKDVAVEKNKLLKKREEKQEMWRACQAYCNQQKPDIEIKKRETSFAQVTGKSQVPSAKEIEKLTSKLAELLKSKVIKHG
jgi:hypothetical protein